VAVLASSNACAVATSAFAIGTAKLSALVALTAKTMTDFMDTRTGMILPLEHVPAGQKQHFVEVKRDLTLREKAEAQIRLYAPCACGSGKKFKFCCRRP